MLFLTYLFLKEIYYSLAKIYFRWLEMSSELINLNELLEFIRYFNTYLKLILYLRLTQFFFPLLLEI